MSLWLRFIDQRSNVGNRGAAKSTDDISNEHGKQRSKCGTHHRSPPMVTLFYDSIKKLTVVVLTRDTDRTLQSYFLSRVSLGSAYEVSPLYYELEGFVRENLFEIRKQVPQHLRDADLVSVAIGSMEDSDVAQRLELQVERESGRRACRQEIADELTVETALEVARVHRLSEDLDVLSIYFMLLTSKSFCRVAGKIAQSRMSTAQLSVTPFVDGVSVAGYSKVVRRDGAPLTSLNLVRQSEYGRLVEYERCPDIALVAGCSHGVFGSTGVSTFSWNCDEIALANLHRWWGDIAPSDYLGHKLVLSWSIPIGSSDCRDASQDSSLALATLRLPPEPRALREGYVWRSRHATFHLSVRDSKRCQLDEVSVNYSGEITLEEVELDFRNLVEAAARSFAPVLRNSYRVIEEKRPIIPQEEAYLREIEALARSS